MVKQADGHRLPHQIAARNNQLSFNPEQYYGLSFQPKRAQRPSYKRIEFGVWSSPVNEKDPRKQKALQQKCVGAQTVLKPGK